MDKKELDEFITAVDVVCGCCTERNEDTCENCPVRKSVDFYNNQK